MVIKTSIIMRDGSFVVIGKGNGDALNSSSHGEC